MTDSQYPSPFSDKVFSSIQAYKTFENKKIIAIIHASIALAAGFIYKFGTGNYTIWFIIAIIFSARSYLYWYMADAILFSIYTTRQHVSEIKLDNKQKSRYDALFESLKKNQRKYQAKVFISLLTSFTCSILGLTIISAIRWLALGPFFNAVIIVIVAIVTALAAYRDYHEFLAFQA